MRQLPAGLADALASGATTLARCWTLTRRDGVVQGFTEHDRDLAFGGVTYRAASGLFGSEVSTRLGLSADAHELHGALASETLTEADLAAGRWDGATVELWLVDWSALDHRVLLRAGTLGEVTRAGAAFVAEVRGLADRLDAPRGRLFAAACDADLGDARCGVSLAAHTAGGSVLGFDATTLLRVSGLGGYPAGRFTGGRLTFTSGANAGLSVEVKSHRVEDDGRVRLSLWQQMPEPIAALDGFTVTAGCDKRFETCRTVFANAANFRGFPHMPGNDFVVHYPHAGEPGHDGGALVE